MFGNSFLLASVSLSSNVNGVLTLLKFITVLFIFEYVFSCPVLSVKLKKLLDKL